MNHKRSYASDVLDIQDTKLRPIELAEREGVPLATVYNWNSTGTGPRYMKIGRHVRYRLRDVVAWEDSRYTDGAAAG